MCVVFLCVGPSVAQLPLPASLVDGHHLTFVALALLLRDCAACLHGCSGGSLGAGSAGVSGGVAPPSPSSNGDALMALAPSVLRLLRASLAAVLDKGASSAVAAAGLRAPSITVDTLAHALLTIMYGGVRLWPLCVPGVEAECVVV